MYIYVYMYTCTYTYTYIKDPAAGALGGGLAGQEEEATLCYASSVA